MEAFFDPDDLFGNETIPIGDATELEDLIISTEDLSSLDLTGGFGGFRRLQLDFSTPATTIVPETTTVIPETTSLDSFTDFEEESVLDAAALSVIALEDTVDRLRQRHGKTAIVSGRQFSRHSHKDSGDNDPDSKEDD